VASVGRGRRLRPDAAGNSSTGYQLLKEAGGDETSERQPGNDPVVGARVSQGVPAFGVTLVRVLRLTIVFARLSAAVFETVFLRHRSRPQDAGQHRPSAEGAPA